MYNGILNINKEKGISSSKCVTMVRKALEMRKVGHTGTLDLEASGVLPIVCGKATRTSDYMMGKDKTYYTEMVFGKRYDTLDFSGKVIDTSDKIIDESDLKKVIPDFIGEIEQIPPMYSALKVDGKKLYDLAREGIEIERKKRKVKVYDIKLLSFDFPKASLEVKCSKGTYIRTLVDDIGQRLGSFAYVDSLTRKKVGLFDIKDAIKSEDLMKLDKEYLIDKMYPLDIAFDNFKRVDLDKNLLKKAINGMVMEVDYLLDETIRVYIEDKFIGLGRNYEENNKYFLKMEKVFYERDDKNI